MPDIASISALLSSVKAATDIAKLIKNSNASLESAEIKFQMAELISTLADVKIELADVQDELREKDRKIINLKSELEKRETMTYDGKLYWAENDNVAFCTVCYEKDSKYHHLTHLKENMYGMEEWYCKVCNTSFHV